ncbi:MAG: 3-phenylpropionate/trans-cinnamate dioxygenase ferredoxin component [Sphingomonadales bacterium]|jgi:nitrite reductase/ring-hydroxylating ferredoxin subunit|nr:3-phenylpropionate/trans-cinnamate dioxygenase ferredoxin component [Sphingomonadales bacterium]
MAERLEGAAKLPCGELQRFEIGGVPICVAHVEPGRYLAVSDICSHEDQSLSEGWLTGCEIECPRHNAIFSLETGEPLSLPAEESIATFRVEVDGDDLIVAMQDGEAG